jgi:glycosyltransferase involved in cell wall biosynthesis
MRKPLRVLMFGWEFPPFHSGGLGVACKGLVKALSNLMVKVLFVLPKKIDGISLDSNPFFYKFIFVDESKISSNLKIKAINSFLSPYITSEEYQRSYKKFISLGGKKDIYGSNLFEEVMRYGIAAIDIALEEEFDIIHAHDWLSFPAGMKAKKITGKPLITHVHATEFDRTGGTGVNQQVYEIEKQGFQIADKIIAVSNFTKNKIIEHYGIDPQKIRVVHNGVEQWDLSSFKNNFQRFKNTGQKIVLFVGRITLQKGVDYFLLAAKKVLEKNPNVFFIIAGTGDMESQIIEQAVSMDISDKVLFAGFVKNENLTELYKMADLYVLPSVSEPFGLTPLEALTCGTPVLISKQSGVSEALSHCLKVDFWDIDEMTNKILAVLEYSELKEELSEHGQKEVQKFSWHDSAQKCIDIYKEVLL